MATFLALYRGKTIAQAQMVAVTADPELVTLVATRLLGSPQPDNDDAVVTALECGRRQALRLITKEANDAPT